MAETAIPASRTEEISPNSSPASNQRSPSPLTLWFIGVVTQMTTNGTKRIKERHRLLAWLFAPIEFLMASIVIFVLSLPWPNWFVDFLLRVDKFVASVINIIWNKLEWYYDIVMIRLMWLRESVMVVFHVILSTYVHIVKSIIHFIARLTMQVLRFITAPIWILLDFLHKTIPYISIPVLWEEGKATPDEFPFRPTPQPKAQVTLAQNPSLLTDEEIMSSDCESDVSLVSESVTGFTNKEGKSCSRLQMTATAEGKLKAAMYNRVRSQLILMRRNSIRISRGMITFSKTFILQRIYRLMDWIKNLFQMEQMLSLVQLTTNYVMQNPFLANAIDSILAFILKLNKRLTVLLEGKAKPKRTRSLRSDSDRRRRKQGSGYFGVTLTLPNSTHKNETPVETDGSSIIKRKLDDSSKSDSALASSLEELSSDNSPPLGRKETVNFNPKQEQVAQTAYNSKRDSSNLKSTNGNSTIDSTYPGNSSSPVQKDSLNSNDLDKRTDTNSSTSSSNRQKPSPVKKKSEKKLSIGSATYIQ